MVPGSLIHNGFLISQVLHRKPPSTMIGTDHGIRWTCDTFNFYLRVNRMSKYLVINQTNSLTRK